MHSHKSVLRRIMIIMLAVVTIAFIKLPISAAAQDMWQKTNNRWWYQHADGTYPARAWERIDGVYYYFNASGYMVSNCWIGYYYLGANGAMLTNTTTPDGYKVDENGRWVPQNVWKHNGRGWWYQHADGTYPARAWELIDGVYYYFNVSGYMVSNCWIGYYYLGANGAMLTNTTTPDGYKVDENGRWIQDAGSLGNLPTANQLVRARVVRVVDGDTIVIDRGYGNEKVRLILVNTPETVHPHKPVEYYGREASNFTKTQLSGRYVYLERDVSEYDRYGRLLRYVWTDIPNNSHELASKCFNAALLLGGYAQLSTFPPDLKYVNEFRAFQQQAHDNQAGLWGNSGAAPSNAANPAPQHNGSSQYNPSDPAYKYAQGQIIGNTNSKIYHMPYGRFYTKVSMKNAVFFKNAAQAEAAGYRASRV